MDDIVNGFARELADAIAKAVAESTGVERVRERALIAGFEMRVNLEAVVGFVNKPSASGLPAVQGTTGSLASPKDSGRPNAKFDVNTNDKRFLKSLRIGGD